MFKIYFFGLALTGSIFLQSIAASGQENELPNTDIASTDSMKAGSASYGFSVVRIKEHFPPPVNNFTRLMEGNTGVQATNGGGQPGAVAEIMVRGRSTLYGSSDPLIILDGMVYTGDLNAIHVQDIKTIDILKDAISSVQYGGRSANGVLVITTKTGNRQNKLQLDVEASAGTVSRGLTDYNVINNSADYYQYTWNSIRNLFLNMGMSDGDARLIASGLQPSVHPGAVGMLGYNPYDAPDNQLMDPATGKVIPSANLRYNDGNWKKALQRIGLRHEYITSVSDAGNIGHFRLSGSYLKENGYIKYTGYERFSGRFNGELHPFRWIKAGVFAAGSIAGQDVPGEDAQGGALFARLFMAPVYPVYYHNADGSTETDPLTGKTRLDYGGNGLRPYGTNVLGSLQSDKHENKYDNRIAVPYIEATLLKQLSFRMQLSYNDQKIRSNHSNIFHGQNINLLEFNSGTSIVTTSWSPVLQWTKTLGKHSIDIRAGYEKFRNKLDYSDSAVTDGHIPSGRSRHMDALAQEEYFATGNYGFGKKYFVSGGYSRMSSSQYAPVNRWNTYWAGGIGWMVSEEAFLKDISWISSLQLRGSYGKQGNTSPLFPSQASSGTSLGNPDLVPPSTYQLNIGTDISLFNQRLRITADYFNKITENAMVYSWGLPTTGPVYMLVNGMSLKNKGFELSVSALPVNNTKHSWQTTLNLTRYKNEVRDLDRPIYGGNTILKNGGSLYDFYMVKSAGVNPENGREQYYYTDASGNMATTEDFQMANTYGRVDMGSAFPELFGSLTNEVRVGNFQLSFLLSFGIGGKYFDNVYWKLMDVGAWGTNVSTDMLQSWTPENRNADLPASDILGGTYATDRFLKSASYLNFRRLQLSYDVPEAKAKKIRLRSLQFYLSADNIWLIAGRKGMDPQATFTNDPGVVYSPARTILLGLRLGL